jgi:adenosine deaminase
VPKAELHLHIEGTLEPELMFEIAARNGITLEGTVETHRKKRENFKDLQDFLDLYYEACNVLRTEEDFRDLMYGYLLRASADNVFVAEIFFDPQTHTNRGVPFDTVVSGLYRGILEGHRDFEIRGSLIMCFLRNLTEKAALATMELAKPHLDKIIGVGLDSGELGNPPKKFKRVFEMAAGMGLKLVSHAGEEGGPEYIREALDVLHVSRIDHGIQCLKDQKLVERLVRENIPLTTCPLSNIKLQVNSRFFDGKNMTGEMLSKGLRVTINSDDPAYFGGYINDNFFRAITDCSLTEKDVYRMCRNSFTASFISDVDKNFYVSILDQFTIACGYAAPPRSVSIFGSRSPVPGSAEYEEARTVARLLSSHGYTVLTGGYNGIMQAGAQGASEGLELGREKSEDNSLQVRGVLMPNVFIQRQLLGNEFLTQHSFVRSLHNRIHHFISHSEYFLVCGGTIGTITEMFFVWNTASLRKTFKIPQPKIFLLRSKWEKSLETFLDAVQIFPEDRALIQYVDTAEEVLKLVEEDLKQRTASATITLTPSAE